MPICSIQKQDNLCTIAQYKYGGEYSTEGDHISLFGRVDSIHHRLHKFWRKNMHALDINNTSIEINIRGDSIDYCPICHRHIVPDLIKRNYY